MSDTDSKILEELKGLRADISDLKADHGKKLDILMDEQAHVRSVLKVLPTKQDLEVTVEAAKSELKADLIRKIQRHERRIENLEDEAGIENPEKN